jgi:hypothetical protein
VGTTLSWTALSGGVVYDVAGAALSDLRANATSTATCLAQDVTTTTFTDARPGPPPAEGWYYLVRARDACGAGTYGLDSASVERSLPAACPEGCGGGYANAFSSASNAGSWSGTLWPSFLRQEASNR